MSSVLIQLKEKLSWRIRIFFLKAMLRTRNNVANTRSSYAWPKISSVHRCSVSSSLFFQCSHFTTSCFSERLVRQARLPAWLEQNILPNSPAVLEVGLCSASSVYFPLCLSCLVNAFLKRGRVFARPLTARTGVKWGELMNLPCSVP